VVFVRPPRFDSVKEIERNNPVRPYFTEDDDDDDDGNGWADGVNGRVWGVCTVSFKVSDRRRDSTFRE